MSGRPFLSDRSGGAGAEMALILPVLLILLFGGFEAGHFVWTEHKLVEAVRDGARFAARMPIDQACDGGTSVLSSTKAAEIRLLTRTGQIANTAAMPKVPGWTDGEVSVTVNCDSFVDTGIYTALGSDSSGTALKGPVVTVSALNVNYPSLLHGLGILNSTVQISASTNAAVIGI